MKTKYSFKTIVNLRRTCQILFTLLFFGLLLCALDDEARLPRLFYFALDPLIPLVSGQFMPLFLLALIPLLSTLLLGRIFCGWICPLGALQHLFSRLPLVSGEKRNKPKNADFKLKYAVLIAFLLTAGFGVKMASVLDPVSFLTRSTALFIVPALLKSTSSLTADTPFDPASHLPPQTAPLQPTVRAFSQSATVGLLFVALLLLSLYRARFFCTNLCPLGALYAVLGRFSLFRIESDAGCDSCDACTERCVGGRADNGQPRTGECVMCFNCTALCSSRRLRFRRPKKTQTKNQAGKTRTIDRRHLFGGLISGLCLVALPKLPFSSAKKKTDLIRPPGALPEQEFLDRCIRCGACIQACPTHCLQAAWLETGLERLWTPVLDASAGYCAFGCTRCTSVCPTNAIDKLDAMTKARFKIGTAVVDKSRCYTYSDGIDCTVCHRHCPVPQKAIRFKEVQVQNYNGETVLARQIYVAPEHCIGCGACQFVCPRAGRPGIFLTSDDEQRSDAFL